MLATWLKRSVMAVVVAAGLWSGGTAMASDLYSPPGYVYKPVVVYVTVNSYETRSQAYQVSVVKYDSYGRPYYAYVTYYRTIQVPVQRVVAVTKYVVVPAY
jgi:hypothetical protein